MAPVEAPPARAADRGESPVDRVAPWTPFEYEIVEPVVEDTVTAGAIRRWLARFVHGLLWVLRMVTRWVASVALGGTFFATATSLLALTYTQLAPHAVSTSPSPTITFSPLAARSVVFARDGTALAVLHSEEDRILVPIDQVPSHVIRAVLDAEDERFL